MTAGEGARLCTCRAAEAAFHRGFRAGAEFVLQLADGRGGEMAHAVARAVLLSQEMGKPITASLIMGALAQAVQALRARAELLLESEERSCWRQLLARNGIAGGNDGDEKETA
jgi:hypothetical protein